MRKLVNKYFSIVNRIFKKTKGDQIDYTSLDIYSDTTFMAIYNKCAEYTMTSIERMYSLYKSVNYIIENNIQGDFVECGVYLGGSSRMIAETLFLLNSFDRKIYMYDTFEGMPDAGAQDLDLNGNEATVIQAEISKASDSANWCFASLDSVKNVMLQSGYPVSNLIFVKGIVEETIPANIPFNISLLRLDTDWYASTMHELKHLYPLLSKNGILLIDDYGHWQGARQAVDEYFRVFQLKPILNRVDYTCRLVIKN